MKEIAHDVERWREQGERVAVATVVATRLSAPRPVGSKFAVSERRSTMLSQARCCDSSPVERGLPSRRSMQAAEKMKLPLCLGSAANLGTSGSALISPSNLV